MSIKKLSEAMNELDAKYVEKAINYQAKKHKVTWIKWGSMAACFALLLICIPTIIHIINPSQLEPSYRQGIECKIKSIFELPAEYKGKLLAQDLELTENAEIDLYYKEGGSAENIGDWFSLIISDTVYSETETVLIGDNEAEKAEKELLLHCFFDGRTAEEQKVDMVFTKDATETIEINGVNVQIAPAVNSLEFKYSYYAVFEYDGIVYDVRTESNQQNYLYDVLDQLLENK